MADSMKVTDPFGSLIRQQGCQEARQRAHLSLDGLAKVLRHVGEGHQQRPQHRQRPRRGGFKVRAHVVVQLMQVDRRVAPGDAQLLAEVVDRLSTGQGSMKYKHSYQACSKAILNASH